MIDYEKIIIQEFTNPMIIKGSRVFVNCKIKITYDDDEWFDFACQSESDSNVFYNIEIEFEEGSLNYSACDCPSYNGIERCKHIVACILHLKTIASKTSTATPTIENKSNGNIATFQTYPYAVLFEWCIFKSQNRTQQARIKQLSVKILSEANKTITATVEDKKNEFNVIVSKTLHAISCECACEHSVTLCDHSRAVLFHILNTTKNPYYIDTVRDITDEKIKLLSAYGIVPEDEEAELFEFFFDQLVLKVKPKNANIITLSSWKSGPLILQKIDSKKPRNQSPSIPEIPRDYILLFRSSKQVPYFRFEVYPIEGTIDNISALLSKRNTEDYVELKGYCNSLAPLIYLLTPGGILETIQGHNPRSYYYGNANSLRYLDPSQINKIRTLVIQKIRAALELLISENRIFATTKANKPKVSDLVHLKFSNDIVVPHLKVTPLGKFLQLKMCFKIGDDIYESNEFQNISNILLIRNKTIYLNESASLLPLLDDFTPVAEKLFPQLEATTLFKKYLLPLRDEMSMDLPEAILPETITPAEVSFAVRLKEMEPDYLLYQPVIMYDDVQAILDGEEIQFLKGEKEIIILRNPDQENKLKQAIQNLHPIFATQKNNPFYYLTFSQAIKDNWFFDSIKKLTDENIAVFGQKELSKFKYNSFKPKLEIKGGSGIDWFDLTIEVSYGAQVVPLKLLRQSIINKQDFIQLDDGTMGILPEEWTRKFRSLFQLSSIKNDNELQVSKLHYTLIHELHEAISEESLLAELENKKLQLQNIDTIEQTALPKNIKAKLRPYQLSGYHWFNQLHKIGWGGCLADDMGLGKTLQTIAFLQNLYNGNKGLKCIIVCPTSLIYNWEAEILKFTKGFPYLIYHGGNRQIPEQKKTKWNLLITSYGTLRNDIEKILTINFDVAILDESQSIKNPLSLATKAVHLIKTKQRFILSGTPVQNNTFDLYSQLNFCNPGLLGNQEFF
jgi:uncharacterized Zn finger protein